MIRRCLIRLGCKEKCVGFKYIVDLIQREIDGISIEPLFREGYQWLSAKYGKTTNSIEKSIQTCISFAWDNGKNSYLNNFFGESNPTSKYKSTNKQFIFTVIDKIKVEMI